MIGASSGLRALPTLHSSLKLRADILCRVRGEKLLNAVFVSELQQCVQSEFDPLDGRHGFPWLDYEGRKELPILSTYFGSLLSRARLATGCSGGVQAKNIPHLMVLGPKWPQNWSISEILHVLNYIRKVLI
jgi:hypothetical protein